MIIGKHEILRFISCIPNNPMKFPDEVLSVDLQVYFTILKVGATEREPEPIHI